MSEHGWAWDISPVDTRGPDKVGVVGPKICRRDYRDRNSRRVVNADAPEVATPQYR